MSFTRLQQRAEAKRNPSVVGLDPAQGLIPPHILDAHIAARGQTLDALADAYLEFNRGVIDALHELIPAVKPQAAYYERLGAAGVRVLKETAAYAKAKGLYVIADAKRNDIGATAAAYSDAFLGAVTVGATEVFPFDFDAVTVNGYLGSDGLLPFLDAAKKYDKAIFVLVKTSNPSSGELQDLDVGGRKLYEAVGDLIENLSRGALDEYGYTRVGAVVGATYPAEMKSLRERLAHTFFLVPGYGAQGGAASDAAAAFDKAGRGAIVNSSRAILGAWTKTGNDGRDYAEAARAEALRMRGALRAELGL
ncbi:MAG: orotidine-5'-phosphate decarboxylase [Oscillospiraceae bacterium]|jgi:orotidine-5'-phosphate decarboxylase|nr:orotidine-5'-phosphate decarboxylase [Oscillospiraceae bacterium]